MAKNEISDYDEVDANNTDISGLPVTNATLIAQVDDIVRAEMGALKRWFKSSLFRLRDSTDQTKLLALDLSGQTTALTRTQKTPDYNGTLASQALGTAIASAATTSIGAATGSTFHITGTTTITALGTADSGIRKSVIFDGVLTLTHNATSLILPFGVNITTAAGDVADFVSEGSGNWRCVSYQRTGDLIITKVASGSASLDFTGLSGCRQIRVTGTVRPATDSVAGYIRVSTNNGVSYDATSVYNYQIGRTVGAASTPIGGTTVGVLFGGLTNLGNAAGEYTSFSIFFEQFNQGTISPFHGTAISTGDTGALATCNIGGTYGSGTARSALQVIMSSGNIADGVVTVEGIRG